MLNDYFSSQNLINDQNKQLPDLDLFTDKTDSITISVQDIKDVLENLDRNKAHGPNHVSPCLLKEGAPILSKPHSILFNRSLRQGYFPSPWKDGYLTPIHKNDDKSSPSNRSLLLEKQWSAVFISTSLTIFRRTKYWPHFSQASFQATAQPFNFYIHVMSFVKLLTQEKK